MAATELQKLHALYQRSTSTSVAGVNLAGDIDTLLQFDQLSADEMRKALREALDSYQAHREQARETYRKRGVELEMANVHELRDILLEAMAMIDAVLMTEYDPLEVAGLNRRAYALMSQQNEPAPAQDEQPVAWRDEVGGTLYPSRKSVAKYLPEGRVATPLYAAPIEQTEQPVAWRDEVGNLYPSRELVAKYLPEGRVATPLYAAPIKQTEQQPEESGIGGEFAEKCEACDGLTYGFSEAKWCCHCGAKLTLKNRNRVG